MAMKFGAKNQRIEHRPFDVKFPTEREKHQIKVLIRTNQKKVMTYVKD